MTHNQNHEQLMKQKNIQLVKKLFGIINIIPKNVLMIV